jgi:hypothetical protein
LDRASAVRLSSVRLALVLLDAPANVRLGVHRHGIDVAKPPACAAQQHGAGKTGFTERLCVVEEATTGWAFTAIFWVGRGHSDHCRSSTGVGSGSSTKSRDNSSIARERDADAISGRPVQPERARGRAVKGCATCAAMARQTVPAAALATLRC